MDTMKCITQQAKTRLKTERIQTVNISIKWLNG